MSTVTLTFNPNNSFAQSVLEMIRKSGVFEVSQTMPVNEDWTADEEREAFLHTSKVNASKMFAKYL